MNLETIIGLEIHIQMNTRTKMFCGCDNRSDGAPPNTAICPTCVGHPGTLPVLNRVAVESGTRMALTLNCRILEHLKFDRKNYFYPDLPKGYQISMFDLPVGVEGHLDVPMPAGPVRIGINRLHLEEDAAKSLHTPDNQWTAVDYNRGGTPLMEIVTEPEFRSPTVAKRFLKELQMIARYLKVSDADMEKGQLRCDVNISLRPMGTEKLFPKTEIKNVNSFKAVERTLEYEVRRQTKLWRTNTPPSELTTRGWDDAKQITTLQRWKEEAGDYRYFPEPDLPPLHTGPGQTIDPEHLRASIPELPEARRTRFVQQLHIGKTDVGTLVANPALAGFVEASISELEAWISETIEEDDTREKLIKKAGKTVGSWTASRILGILHDHNMTFESAKITPENFAELLSLFLSRRINSTIAQQLLEQLVIVGGDPSTLLEEMGTEQVSNSDALRSAVLAAINANPESVGDYRSGKTNAIQFLVGQVMRTMRGTADPEAVRELLSEELSNSRDS
jgi:aspartyl-tRNA(Asn)/glutamyl-tRNA(Gln) amidotransferase subunit B